MDELVYIIEKYSERRNIAKKLEKLIILTNMQNRLWCTWARGGTQISEEPTSISIHPQISLSR